MHNLYEELTTSCEILSEELKRVNDKLEKSGGSLNASDLDYIDKLTHALKSVKTTKAMMESEESGYSMARGGSNAGGSNMYMPRYAYESYRGGGGSNRSMSREMGSYESYRGGSRESGYSGAAQEVLMELREAMEKAPDERSRMRIKQLIDEMEQM